MGTGNRGQRGTGRGCRSYFSSWRSSDGFLFSVFDHISCFVFLSGVFLYLTVFSFLLDLIKILIEYAVESQG